LTHQLLYVPNDSSFNEALATAVEEEGVKRWLLAQGREADFEAHRLEHARYVQVIDLLALTREELRAVYRSGDPPARMRERKRAAFESMRAEFSKLRAGWGGYAPLEAWVSADLNNAHLASIATYFSCVPGLERELAAVGGDLPAFYARARVLARLGRDERDALLCR
jgi:predicted aminopeptidase